MAKDVDRRKRNPSYRLIYHRDNPKAMDSSKSENSVLPLHPSGSPVSENRENRLAKKLTPTYESTTFSRPVIDKLNGILPDFNRRLSPERDLGLSSSSHSRLSSETFPRLVSDSCLGLSCSQFPETLAKRLETPVGKGFELKPDLAGRMLTGTGTCSLISPDLPIAPLESRFVTLRKPEDGLKEAKKDKTNRE